MSGSPDEVFDDRDSRALVEGQLAGKDAIRPIFARLSSVIEELGDDVTAEPGETSVVFWRGREFAALLPSSATRLDLGLVLEGEAETERLRPAGSSGGAVTHRVSLAHEDEIDDELTTWLRAAYDAARR